MNMHKMQIDGGIVRVLSIKCIINIIRLSISITIIIGIYYKYSVTMLFVGEIEHSSHLLYTVRNVCLIFLVRFRPNRLILAIANLYIFGYTCTYIE